MGLRDVSYNIRDHLIPFDISVNPNYISLMSVLLTLPILYIESYLLKVLIVFLVLFLDSLDGYVARKQKMESRNGLAVDISCDRISELIIFSFNPLLLIVVYVNIILSVMKLKKEWFILPLRHVYLLWLLVKAFGFL